MSGRPPPSQVIREEYNRISDKYAELYEGDGPLQYFYQSRLKLVSELLEPGTRGMLLDVGSGPGIFGDQARALGFQYVAADVSVGMARESLKRAPRDTRAVAASADALPFPDAAFDAVTALGVFEYVERLELAFAECGRVLRPGGRFVVSVLNHRSPYRWFQRIRRRFTPGTDRIPAVHFTRSRANALLSGAGFQVTRVLPFDMEVLPEEVATRHPRLWKLVQQLSEPLITTPLGRFSSAMLIHARRA